MYLKVLMILTSCCLFIHLGLGNTISKVIGYNFVLFRCPKCLAFWSVLSYLLLSNQSVVLSIFIAFICAYLELWIELLLTIIADKDEEIYESLGTKESKNSDGKQRGKDHQRNKE